MDRMREFRGRLKFSMHRVGEELEIQAEVLDEIGRELSRAEGRHALAADKLKRAESTAFAQAKMDGSSDKLAELSMRNDPYRIEVFDTVQKARQEVDDWRSLQEAWKERGFSLKGTVALYSAKYFDSQVTGPGNERPVSIRRDYTVDPPPRARVRAT